MAALYLPMVAAPWATANPASPWSAPDVPPINRATAALEGLLQYYQQTERNGTDAPRAKDCPCYTYDGHPCSKNACAFCGPKAQRDDYHCFTTNDAACNCDDPAGPLPAGANSAATFPFACGQLGGAAAPGVAVLPGECLCQSDWPSACENCYRWWSAVALEAMVNYAITVGLSPQATGAHILEKAESMWLHSPYVPPLLSPTCNPASPLSPPSFLSPCPLPVSHPQHPRRYNARWNATERPSWVDDFAWSASAHGSFIPSVWE